ncbi:MAG: haloacid dehalogenase type II [Acetobacteraceae bacterium]
MTLTGSRPDWLTFDCYGTLIQWDEGLIAAVRRILDGKGGNVSTPRFIEIYDGHEHALEAEHPHQSFARVSERALALTMQDLSLRYDPADAALLTGSIGRMPPFPEVVEVLGKLKDAGFRLAIISNADDTIIAQNVAQLGGHIDRVITAEQAGAYKPSPQIFEHAWDALGIERSQLVHICASPHLDLVAAQALGFRTVWIDRGTGRKPLGGYRPDATGPTLEIVPRAFAAAGWM